MTTPASPNSGFSFTAPALILNGQNVGGSFNFDLPVVAASSATDAYKFVGSQNASALSFLSNTFNASNSETFKLLNNQTDYLNQIGTTFANAASSAAGKITSGGNGIIGNIFQGLGALGSFL
jgi:hypothetical protein